MGDPRVILNPNPTFDAWTGIVPDTYTVTGTTANVRRLRRSDPREHPQRAWFPKALKSSDYVFDGESSLGWFGVTTELIEVTTARIPVQAGQNLNAVFAFKWANDSDSINIRARLLDSGTPVANLAQNSYRYPRQIVGTPPTLANAIRSLPGRSASYRFTSDTTERIKLKGASATDGPNAQPYWQRYGIGAFEIPAGLTSPRLDFQVSFTAGPAGTSYFALGEIRIEAVDSYVAAGG